MKKTLFTFCLVLTSFLTSEAHITKISSGTTDACAEAITNSIFALNDLTESQYCELYTIMHNASTTNAQKWAMVSANGNLTTYYNTLNSSVATLQANNFNKLSAMDVTLVKDKLRDNLLGRPNIVECNAYYVRCGELLDQNWDCIVAAFATIPWGGAKGYASAMAACDAILIRGWIKNQMDNPGCGPFFEPLMPRYYIYEFTATDTICNE